MNLSGAGGLAAIQGFRDAQNDNEKRQRFEWERQKAEAELSNLDAKARAERFGYDLTAGQNQAGLQLLPAWKGAQESNYNETVGANQERAAVRPGRIANTLAQQNIDNYGLNRAAIRQPTKEDTADAQSELGLNDLRNALSDQPLEQKIKRTNLKAQAITSDDVITNLPNRLQTAAMQGVIDNETVKDVLQGAVADRIGNNDKQGAIDLLNKSAKTAGINRTVVDIQPTSTGYNIVNEDGSSHELSVADAYKSRQRYLSGLKSGKFHFLAAKDGSVVAGDERTGQTSVVYQGNPAAMGAEHKPAEVQTAEWLVKNGIAKDTNQAWNMVTSTREKTRSSFVMDFVAKNAMPGQDPSKVAQQGGQIYDMIKQSEGSTLTQSTQGSNNAQGDKLLKKLNLGVP